MKNSPAAIHVWYDAMAAIDRGSQNYYSVSVVDENGDEISCDRGHRHLVRAWEMGCEMADDMGLPCVEPTSDVALVAGSS